MVAQDLSFDIRWCHHGVSRPVVSPMVSAAAAAA
jgi:hypothetical protein